MQTIRLSLLVPLMACLEIASACSSKHSDNPVASSGASGDEAGSSSSSAGASGGGSSSQGGSPSSGGKGPQAGGGPTSAPPGGGSSVGQLDSPPADTSLPALPKLSNVRALQREDSAGIDFDPVDGAVDYRVYPLPSSADIKVNANNSLTIKNAIYRCAGQRQTFDLPNNLNSTVNNGMTTPKDPILALAGSIYPPITATVPDKPTLGYVFTEPGADRSPVYAVGVYPGAKEIGWRESRSKIYTTDMAERQTLLAKGGRDDGIAFYVPSAAGAGTKTIYHSENASVVAGPNWTHHSQYYFSEEEKSKRAGDSSPPSAAFQILSDKADGAVPLMSVFYATTHDHTELAVGQERFKRASGQGPGPLWHLEWAGITEETTLVVEALASGCPFQGFLGPQALSAPPHQPFLTLDQLQKASPSGEVFINGQFDAPKTGPFSQVIKADAPVLLTPDLSPVPVARSFVKVKPVPHDPAAWDWYAGFNVDTEFGPLTPAPDPKTCSCQTASSPPPCNSGGGGCGYWTSPTLNIGIYRLDNPENVSVFGSGQVLGQFWSTFDDWAQDTTSTLRFTAPPAASINADGNRFLHVTWSVNSVGTDRRYPQLIISDQQAPVEDGFTNPDSNYLLVQTINGPSMRLQAEAFHGLFNGKPWAVNNQAPYHALTDYDSGNYPEPGKDVIAMIPPAEPPFEHAGMDRMTKFDAYVSADRLYVFMDGSPAGCTKYPDNGFALKGSVTVTFGDVMYHEGAPDELVCYQAHPFPYMNQHECTESKRLWDDLGFKSDVAPPQWDTNLFPCEDY